MVRRDPRCRPGSRGPAPGCRRGSRARVPRRGEMRWRFTSRAYLERISVAISSSVAQVWGAAAAPGVPRRGTRRGGRAPERPPARTRAAAPRHPRAAAAAPRVPRRGTRDVPGRHPRPAPELPARHPRPAPGVPAWHPGPGPEVPARHPRCRHHTERKLAGRVDSPSRAQIAPPRWLHTPVGVPWR